MSFFHLVIWTLPPDYPRLPLAEPLTGPTPYAIPLPGVARRMEDCLGLQLYLRSFVPFIVPVYGPPLMSPPPPRPGENPLDALLHGQHELPEEAPNLGDTQGDRRPRAALNATRLLARARSPFFAVQLLARARPATRSAGHTPTWPR